MAETIKDKAEKAGHKIAEKATEVGHKVGEKVEEAKDWAKETAHKVGNRVEETVQKAEQRSRKHLAKAVATHGVRCAAFASTWTSTARAETSSAESTTFRARRSSSRRTTARTAMHHFIPTSWVARVDDHVHLSKNCGEAKREWKSE